MVGKNRPSLLPSIRPSFSSFHIQYRERPVREIPWVMFCMLPKMLPTCAKNTNPRHDSAGICFEDLRHVICVAQNAFS